MIDKPLNQITFADIDQFVQEKWPEGKTVDYKRDAYGNRDEDKKELLKDVSSFASTQGGDILIGVDEDKGVPVSIPGVTVPDIDKERLRLEEIIRRGLDPRIDFAIHHVLTPSSSAVIVIRVQESLLFPHRVVYQGKFGEFWARSSAGSIRWTPTSCAGLSPSRPRSTSRSRRFARSVLPRCRRARRRSR